MQSPQSLQTGDAWERLNTLSQSHAHRDLRTLFASDGDRASRFTVQAADLRIDFSKNLVSPDVAAALLRLGEDAQLSRRYRAMIDGDPINTTEHRPVLHTALRRGRDETLMVNGSDVVAPIHHVLDKMRRFSSAVRDGSWQGCTRRAIRTVVNIGIGGSDLGPAMAVAALRGYATAEIDVRFVSNVDPADLLDELHGAEAETTLFIIASKTFTTTETMANAGSARSWLRDHLGADADIARHFVALSTNEAAVTAFGIDPENMFEFWDWVGGRYSMCSAIGLSLMVAIGPDHFDDMLSGFRAMDQHTADTPLPANGPMLAGLIGIWNRNFLGFDSHAVLPYAQQLERFPAYLQQLDMESNGKSVHHDGSAVGSQTGPIVWGEPGTNGQHAFFQLLHQGTTVVPSDLIGFLSAANDVEGQHLLLFANLVAQAEALAFGRSAEEVDDPDVSRVPHRTFTGNRPTTLITAPELTPTVLGQLVGFYEHKIFSQGVIWGINSFDQWGVELGKALAATVVDDLGSPDFDTSTHDSSTSAIIELYRSEHA